MFASGFTNAMDLAFDKHGTLWVLEIDHDSLFGPVGPSTDGAIFAVDRKGNKKQLELEPGTLTHPGGITVGDDGALYVTNHADEAGNGEVLRIKVRRGGHHHGHHEAPQAPQQPQAALLSRLPRGAPRRPHRGDRVLLSGSPELALPPEAHALVAPVVRRDSFGFEVGGSSLLVDAHEVLGEQVHAQALASVTGMSAEQAEVVVRLVPRMRRLEALDELQDLAPVCAREPVEQRLQLLLLVRGQLGSMRRDPDRGGGVSRP